PGFTLYSQTGVIVIAGQTAIFNVAVSNSGQTMARGVTLSAPLPAGPGGDIFWKVSNLSSPFVIAGTLGHQTLTFAPGFSTMSPRSMFDIDFLGVTTKADAPPPSLLGILRTTAVVSAQNEAPALQNNRSTASLSVVQSLPTVVSPSGRPTTSSSGSSNSS